MDGLIYLCAKCNESFDESGISSHVCWSANKDNEEENERPKKLGNEEFKIESYLTPQKKSQKQKRDGWKEEDVKQLLNIYIKNYKTLPYKERHRTHFLWDRIMRDLKQHGDFSRFLVQSKMKKLKNSYRAIMAGPSASYEWPYYQQMVEILKLESETSLGNEDEDHDESANNAEEETESDEGADSIVQGLHRWTIKETRHLLQVYMKHLPKFFTNGPRRKILWIDVLDDLAYNLPQRFSVYQIRAKIRNVQNTYRSIIEKKRKKNISYWPLFNDVARLNELEKKLSGRNYDREVAESVTCILGDDENEKGSKMEVKKEKDEKNSEIRWNREETEELLNEYKDRMFIINGSSQTQQEKAWKEIADSVNLIRRKKITPEQAKEKVTSLKTLFTDDWDHGETSPIIYALVKEILDDEEMAALIDSKQVDEPKNKKNKKIHLVEKSKKTDNSLPSWYVQYEEDANRRHQEKMDVLQNIISVLESIIVPN